MRKIVLIVLISIANFWMWRIFAQSSVLAVALIFLSIFLILRLKVLSLILMVLLSIFLLRTSFDTNLLYVSPLERDNLVHRYEYYSQSLGRIYRNGVVYRLHFEVFPYIAKLQNNLKYNLDPNLYFFANHPRERAALKEFSKFSPFLFPIFLIGFATLLSKKDVFIFVYLTISLIVSSVIYSGYNLGPVLIFPFMVGTIYFGFQEFFKSTR